MLQLINKTTWPAALIAGIDHQDRPIVTVVVKSTRPWAAAAGAAPPIEEPIHYAALPWEQAAASARRPADVACAAAGTDVLVCGEAVMPRPTATQLATITLPGVETRLRLSGPRRWEKGLLSWGISDPTPFTRLPLCWEQAVGGVDAKGRRSPWNPVGRGWAPPKDGDLLPCIDDPAKPYQRPGDRPEPVCTAPVAPGWQPRLAFAGTYDAAWQTDRAPLLPKDFDPRFHRQAPGALALTRHLAAGEQIRLAGFTPTPAAAFVVPGDGPQVIVRLAGRDRTIVPTLDQIAFIPDAGIVTLTWRHTLVAEATAVQFAWVLPRGGKP